VSRILLVHGPQSGLGGAAAALAGLAASVDHQPTLDGVDAQCQWDLVVVDYDGLPAGQQAELTARFPGQARRTHLVAVSAGESRPRLAELFARGTLINLLARNGSVHADDLVITARKLLGGDIFGLDKYVAAPAASADLRLVCSSERVSSREASLKFALENGASRRLATTFCDALDELLTNAIYNGPRGPDSGPRWFNREQDVTLGQHEAIEVKLRAGAQRLGVSVQDPFGSLHPQRVTDYLAKCFRQGEDQVDTKEGGAGLGLYYAFEHFSHFVLNLAPKRVTEAIGLMDLGSSFKSRARSFNLFVGQ
jgi:hypothetical protein